MPVKRWVIIDWFLIQNSFHFAWLDSPFTSSICFFSYFMCLAAMDTFSSLCKISNK